MPILKATNLHKSFSKPTKIDLLKGVDLTVHEGDTVAILGRSGQGKSTLLQILGTLDTSTCGLLEIAGQKVTTFNKTGLRNKCIGFIFQMFHLLEDYTAIENVMMPARIARKNINKGSAAYVRAYELLEKVGLSERANHYTKLLSGGEKQRVAIARAMCNDPDILFADEPSGNLDDETAAMIHDLLLGFGKTVITVTHDPRLAALCDHQYELEQGLLLPRN